MDPEFEISSDTDPVFEMRSDTDQVYNMVGSDPVFKIWSNPDPG